MNKRLIKIEKFITTYGNVPTDAAKRRIMYLIAEYGNSRELEGRIDEREGMQFFDQQTFEETHRPYLEYRFTGDGLKLSWEDRTKELESQKEKTNE